MLQKFPVSGQQFVMNLGVQLSLAVPMAVAAMPFVTAVAELLNCEVGPSKFAFGGVLGKNDLRQLCACMLISAIMNL